MIKKIVDGQSLSFLFFTVFMLACASRPSESSKENSKEKIHTKSAPTKPCICPKDFHPVCYEPLNKTFNNRCEAACRLQKDGQVLHLKSFKEGACGPELKELTPNVPTSAPETKK